VIFNQLHIDMSCGISSGVGITCDALRKVGGVKKSAFAFNINDLNALTISGSGYVTALNFATYAGLYELQGKKSSHSGGYTLVNQTPGGNKFYNHNVMLTLFPENPAEDTTVEDLAVSDVAFILEDNNQQFFLYGAYNGMEQTEGVQTTGQEATTNIGDVLTFVGEEQKKPLRILVTDYATTKAYIESLVV
jgi:hypothetical protein